MKIITRRRSRPSLPSCLRGFSVGAVALLVLCLSTEYLCRRLLHLPQFPYGTYIRPETNYGDLLFAYPRFKEFHSDHFFEPSLGAHFLYPAGAAPLYKLIYTVGGAHSLRAFLLVSMVIALLAAALFCRALRNSGLQRSAAIFFTCIALTCSYPLYFDVNRGNIEIFVWVICGVGLWTFFGGNFRIAAALFGLAGALKLYPLIYLGLLLSRKQIRPLLFGIGIFFTATLASLWAITPNIRVAWRGIQGGLTEFASMYVVRRRYGEIGFDHSLPGLAKRLMTHMPVPVVFARGVRIYLSIAALTGVALYVGRIRRLPMINQVLCLTIACILLPPTSYDYTLLHLYLPWTMLVLLVVDVWRKSDVPLRGLGIMFACFVVLLGPESEFIYHGERFGGQVKAVTLLFLFALALTFRFPSRFDDDGPRSDARPLAA